jgi:predicted signal transduction protein with EAL and GGDEF domain
MGWGLERLRGLIDAGEVETVGGRILLEERFRALQRQVPLLYVVIFANMVGLYLAAGGRFDSFVDFPLLVGALIAMRVAHWLKVRNRSLSPERILYELRKMLAFSVVFSVAFSAWSFTLMATRPPTDHDFIILFASLAAIGCAYGVSRYPAAARTPLLLLGLPLSGRLIFTSDPAHVAMGVGLFSIILALLWQLGLHDEGFRELVESRTAVTLERERAQRAERTAKAEKAKARLIADTDPLTGLANRRAFLRALGRRAAALARSRAGGSHWPWSTSTASSRSTTPSATPPATGCWKVSEAGLRGPPATTR